MGGIVPSLAKIGKAALSRLVGDLVCKDYSYSVSRV